MINDYSTLQSAISDWIKRADLTAAIPTFIQLAEIRMGRDVRLRKAQTEISGSTVSNAVPIPADYGSTQILYVAYGGSNIPIYPKDASALATASLYTVPCGYVMVGDEAKLIGTADSYTLIYYARPPALSDSNTTNWLLTQAPDLYLYASLLEVAPYLKNDARIATWAGGYKAALDNLHMEDQQARYANSRARPDIQTP